MLSKPKLRPNTPQAALRSQPGAKSVSNQKSEFAAPRTLFGRKFGLEPSAGDNDDVGEKHLSSRGAGTLVRPITPNFA